MGTKRGFNYACLLKCQLEEPVFQPYRGHSTEFYKRFIDDIVSPLSFLQEHIELLIDCMQSFRLAIELTNNIPNK